MCVHACMHASRSSGEPTKRDELAIFELLDELLCSCIYIQHTQVYAYGIHHAQVRSPFVLDMLCSYINAKDVVIALRYMAGGDLSIYMKQARSRAKKEPRLAESGSFGLDAIAVDKDGTRCRGSHCHHA